MFLIHGDEDFLVKRELANIGSSFFKGRQFSKETYSPSNSVFEDIYPNIFAVSLFSQDRMVVLEGFDDEQLEKVLDNAVALPESTCVVIYQEKADRRTKFFKKAASAAKVIEIKPFSDRERDLAVDWLVSEFKKYGKTIARKTASLLFDVSGPSLRQLCSEAEKLSTYSGGRQEVTEQDIYALSVGGELSAFALENAISARDVAGAVVSVNKMLRAKERPEVIIGRLASRVRSMALVISLTMKNAPKSAVTERFGISPYYYERLREAAGKYTLDELLLFINSLSEADLALKTTSQPQNIILEKMLIGAMSRDER